MFPDFRGIVALAMLGLFVGIPAIVFSVIVIVIFLLRHIQWVW